MKSSLSLDNLERLFLFEVYIETLKIDYPKLCLTKACLDSLGETIIRFQFLGFPPVEIREDDLDGKEEESSCGERKIMAGKTCLFSFRERKSFSRLEVSLSVRREVEDGGSLEVGACSLQLGENFADILKGAKPRSASLSESIALFGEGCAKVGRAKAVVRLSSYGKMITTSFQLDCEDSKTYVVQPGGEVPLPSFISSSEGSLQKGQCPKEYAEGRLLGGTPEGYAGFQDAGIGVYQGGDAGVYEPSAEEFVGLLGGKSEAALPPKLPFCECDYPLPPGLFAPQPPARTKEKKKKKRCPQAMMKDLCTNPACPMGYPGVPVVEERRVVCQAMQLEPGTIGLKAEQVLFQLGANRGNTRARYDLGGGVDCNLRDVRVMGEGEARGLGEPDRKADVFVMRVGKNDRATEQRQRVVLELKQPKAIVEEKVCTDIRTQYCTGDFQQEQPKAAEKKKKKKGKKKGKGKKEKKMAGRGKK